MRGEDDLVEGELYKGTAKSAEGYAADEAFGMAKDDGMHVEVQWQDADSSSSASFRKHYPDKTKSCIMLCAGHVGRCHMKALTKLSQKSFTKRYKTVAECMRMDMTCCDHVPRTDERILNKLWCILSTQIETIYIC